MNGYGASLIAVLDNYFGHEVTAEEAIRYAKILDEATDQQSLSIKVAELADLLDQVQTIESSPALDMGDVFSVEAQYRYLIHRTSDLHANDFSPAVNALKMHLLYYPRLLIGPPILLPIPERGPTAFVSSYLRQMTPLLRLRPLVESNIILVAPERSGDLSNEEKEANKAISGFLAEVIRKDRYFSRKRLEGLLFNSHWAFSLLGLFPDLAANEPKELWVVSAAAILLDEIQHCEHSGANFVAQDAMRWRLAQSYLSMMGAQLSSTEEIDWYYGSLLQQIELPNLETLGTNDIIAIRRNEQEFEDWRIALRGVLRHFAEMPHLPSSFDAEFHSVAAEMLLPHAKALQSHVKQHRSLREAAKNASIRFSLAAIGAFCGGVLLGHPLSAVIGAISGRALVELRDVTKARATYGERALLTHYSLLTSQNPK